MKCLSIKELIFLLVIVGAGYSYCAIAQDSRPNIIVIVSDDQGWGDVGFNGGTDIPTPHLDTLARHGVAFESGYVSHPYCSPSRAGLLSGRYQHRFGHENNTPYENATDQDGLPLDELLISELLQSKVYRTCAIGKWHLGDHKKFWPSNRGFDDWYGFYGGATDYWGDLGNKSPIHGVLRDGKPVPKSKQTYLTDDFSQAATDYIDQYVRREEPFFMYLAYNAPHAPIQVPKKYLTRVDHIEDGKRAAYAAMVVAMDDGIGKILGKLKETGTYESTLIFFLSDNGGHIHGANSLPFRGHKGMLFEGGIRVPFLVSWPDQIRGQSRYTEPVSALDIYPTILSAAHSKKSKSKPLDGVDLLPYLKQKKNNPPHQHLFWRYSDGVGYAVRSENYKMVYSGYKEQYFLFDMASDPYEHHNLALKQPEKLRELIGLYEQWSGGTVKAKWYDPHPENIKKEEAIRQKVLDQASAGERKK